MEQLVEPKGGIDRLAATLTPEPARSLGQAYVDQITAFGGGKARVVDKMPTNFLVRGLIPLILPGVLAEAEAGFGAGLRGSISVDTVTRIGCAARRPRCSAAALPIARFGLMGDGLDGEGFKAVLGLSLAGRAADNPLWALGARRWIVSLPRPSEPGRASW